MRSATLALAVTLTLVLGGPVGAEEAAAPAGEVPEAAPAAVVDDPAPEEPAAAPSRRRIELGPVGRDAQGRPGRLHVVQTGDTLWDVSDAYLGTPWVWPSIWNDNEGIANPHRIYPGDRIWITPNEMRRVSEEEAKALLAGASGGDLPAALDVDGIPGESFGQGRTFRFPGVQTVGFVTDHELDGAAAIVDSPVERTWLGDHDEVVIGLGADATEKGERFAVFRTSERVSDPATGDPIGWATEELGWLEVTEVHPDSATAVVRLSRSEMRRGDRLVPLTVRSAEIPVRRRPEVEGRVVHTPASRLQMGSADVVYLDRGKRDGLDIGSPLEVYRPMGEGVDAARDEEVALPDHVVAKLLVVEARDETAVAVVTHATSELNRGDLFRGSDSLAPAPPAR